MLGISHTAYYTGLRWWAGEHGRRTYMNQPERATCPSQFSLEVMERLTFSDSFIFALFLSLPSLPKRRINAVF